MPRRSYFCAAIEVYRLLILRLSLQNPLRRYHLMQRWSWRRKQKFVVEKSSGFEFQLLALCMLVSQSSPTLCDPMVQPTRLLCPWNSPGKNTWVGCHSLLQKIFLTQWSIPGLLHCRQILYHLSYREVQKRSWPGSPPWCGHSPRAKHPRLWSQVNLRKHWKKWSESESHSVVSDPAAPWTIQSMEFSRPEYWSR